MKNAINWFEIPVKNYERAKKFYTSVLSGDIKDMHMDGAKYGFLPFDESDGVGGAIVKSDFAVPSVAGCVIYLNGGEDLQHSLSRVEESGGKIVMPKTSIGEEGFIAQFLDTEGNKLALHSMN
jgi:predicted enzyme related to lactoylglutathione lyase